MSAPPQPGYPGPASPATGKMAALRGRGASALIATVALGFAVVSGGMAAVALSKANRATDSADRLAAQLAQPVQVSAGQPVLTPTPTATEDEDDGPAGGGGGDVTPADTAEVSLDPQQVWDVKYVSRDLTVQTTRWRPIDLDAPLVDDTVSPDMTVYETQGLAVSVGFPDGVRVAAASSDAISPYECSQNMQFSPLDSATTNTFSKGESFCVRTSREAAAQRAESQQMVVVTVKDISLGGTVVLTARAWKVPG